ncbi:hypothetical protein D9619_010947 [Psilocybe cf. subviscida]|uniref:NAD(P)-binding protein n=1 Tax=Psilocybe cf. subviscida TaxID=2480587 RepID=A0A8H5B984_9AGAR|nr:hypothetical protein D9619_010947 [Psilocybe cf. subviscida]
MGNLFSREFDPSTDVLDLQGKVAIVTGGNTGIGLATVRHLARAGATVYLAARNEARASAAIAQLAGEGLTEITWLKLDLDDPRDAQKAAQEFLRREKRLDILINNAGMISAPYKIGPDGVSVMAMVNYLSPFVFTRALTPLLVKTAREVGSDVRIVNVTSIAHRLVPSGVKFENIFDLNIEYRWRPLSGFIRYGHSKLMQVLWTKSLQRHLNEDPLAPITVISVHPGGVDTFTHTWPFPRLSKWVVGLTIATTEIGAYNSLFAAASKRVAADREKYKGAYLESQPTGRIASPHKAALDEQSGTQLWSLTEAFLDGIGV